MPYDLIVVGSGNGACAFLRHYLSEAATPDERILVLEEGATFFRTSDITHQYNWTRSYAEGSVFKLHDARTGDNRPIISGRASTQGGGGSVNYTMIFESSAWLAEHLGHDEAYWDARKKELADAFDRPDPLAAPSPILQHVMHVAEAAGFAPSSCATGHIPDLEDAEAKRLYPFPTQFNRFGQRTHSGVSLVDWGDPRLTLRTRVRAERLELVDERCELVHARDCDTGEALCFGVARGGRVMLCAGGVTPQLLRPLRDALSNIAIGADTSDHIVLPLGIYLVDRALTVSDEDVYVPVFATTAANPDGTAATVCCFDFFAGDFHKMWFILAHLYQAFLLPNWAKRFVIRNPWAFTVTKTGIRVVLSIVTTAINVGWGLSNWRRGKPFTHRDLDLITAIVKFNPAGAGRYAEDGHIDLELFSGKGATRDAEVARHVIEAHLPMLDQLGRKPPALIRRLLRLLSGLPYEAADVTRYVERYSRKFLLSEQHLSGGCLMGQAADTGLNDPGATGRVHGSENLYVADLSAVPLPRISTQMTAYLIGHHVAYQLALARRSVQSS